MRFLRGLFPHVAARRAWHEDGTPVWEFRFTSRAPKTGEAGALPTVEARPPVRFVSSRGVELGGDTLWIDQFHHRIRKPSPDVADGHIDVASALVELAAAPDVEAAQHRVVAGLARDHTYPSTPLLEISAARITGGGLGHRLDGVFIWRAEGRPDLTFLVAPDPTTRDLLAADLDLVRALIRAACPQPDDPLGEMESSLRETLTRLGVTGGPAEVQRTGVRSPADLVLKVNPRPDRFDRSDRAEQPKSPSERALSNELAELARKVGTASVRAPGRPSKAG